MKDEKRKESKRSAASNQPKGLVPPPHQENLTADSDSAWHNFDHHSLTLAYQGHDDYPLRYYCDICEERRDLQKWFYRCETCDNAMHIECVLGEYPFIKDGSKYTYGGYAHPLTSIRKVYYYPECSECDDPCQDLALKCEEE